MVLVYFEAVSLLGPCFEHMNFDDLLISLHVKWQYDMNKVVNCRSMKFNYCSTCTQDQVICSYSKRKTHIQISPYSMMIP